MKVVISGIGQHSAMGQGLASMAHCLSSEKKPNIETINVQTRMGERQIPQYRAPEVDLPAEIPAAVQRRMSRLAKMCLSASIEACGDAFDQGPLFFRANPKRVGLVIGTGFGCLSLANVYQRRVILEGAQGASPSLFAASVQNSLASQLSIVFGIQGPCSTVSTVEQTTLNAMSLATDWILEDIVDHVVVCVGDELSDYHAYFMANLKNIPKTLHPQSNDCTACVGEGVVSFVLSKSTHTQRPTPYAEIAQIDLAVDSPISTPRVFAGANGQAGHWQSVESHFVNHETSQISNHAEHYGSTMTGLAFEIAIAAIQVKKDKIKTQCVQIVDQLPAQRLILTATESLDQPTA